MSHNIFYRILHGNVQCVAKWIHIDGRWVHYPLVCSRCAPDQYYEKYQKMMRLATDIGGSS